MEANYKNWVPKGAFFVYAAGAAVAAGLFWAVNLQLRDSYFIVGLILKIILGIIFLCFLAMLMWSVIAYRMFSYHGKRKMSMQIIEGLAEYVTLPEGGKGLDVGCGSGALTIACAKRNPQGVFVGVDRWGQEYASFNQELCEKNAEAAGVLNVRFQSGNAKKLDFPDETFDTVTSNYVYHNILGVDRKILLRETLRVLKKGGSFAIHDVMAEFVYGDIQKFAEELRAAGFAEVNLIPTDNGKFLTKREGRLLLLSGSMILTGRK